MSARFDKEIMEHLDKLFRKQCEETARSPRGAAARMSIGERAAFAAPGQNPAAVFQEDASALRGRNDSKDSPSPLEEGSDEGQHFGVDDASEDFPADEILQPRRLSLRVF